MKPGNKAFTLIELLVVIAIIAILAAILFPVFAQAKAAAKVTVCVSNVKNIATAQIMYQGDYDDQYLTVERDVYGYCNPNQGDAPVRLAPYIKNWDIWFCPVRPRKTYPAGACSWNPKNYLLGYGTNFGIWSISDNIGVYREWMSGDADYSAAIGHRLSEVERPANFIVGGQTNDYPYYTLGLAFQSTDGSGLAQIYHNGHWPYYYSDGHAKPADMGAYISSGYGFTILPKNEETIKDMCIELGKKSYSYPQYTCEGVAHQIATYRTPFH